MVAIQNKRLMLSDGMESNFTPNLNDFMFYGGGKGGGGGVYTIKQKPKPVPKAPEQATANEVNDTDVTIEDDELVGGGKRKSLGGTRKLAIPVTTAR